jgi:undecaprenyl-diphosphatase
VLLERSILIGLVVPGDVILAIGGIQAARSEAALAGVVALGTAAALMGESTGFWLGRRYGLSIVRRIPFVNRIRKNMREVERLFERHGGKTVVIGRYAAAAGAFVPFVAGMGRMRYRRFLAFDVPSVIVWAAAISIVGFIFGENLDFVDTLLSRFGWVVLLLAVALLGGYIWWRRRTRRAVEDEMPRSEDGEPREQAPQQAGREE